MYHNIIYFLQGISSYRQTKCINIPGMLAVSKVKKNASMLESYCAAYIEIPSNTFRMDSMHSNVPLFIFKKKYIKYLAIVNRF